MPTASSRDTEAQMVESLVPSSTRPTVGIPDPIERSLQQQRQSLDQVLGLERSRRTESMRAALQRQGRFQERDLLRRGLFSSGLANRAANERGQREVEQLSRLEQDLGAREARGVGALEGIRTDILREQMARQQMFEQNVALARLQAHLTNKAMKKASRRKRRGAIAAALGGFAGILLPQLIPGATAALGPQVTAQLPFLTSQLAGGFAGGGGGGTAMPAFNIPNVSGTATAGGLSQQERALELALGGQDVAAGPFGSDALEQGAMRTRQLSDSALEEMIRGGIGR